VIAILLILAQFTTLRDAAHIAIVADSLGVRRDVAEAVAWMETRDGSRWRALGPGVIDSTWLNDGTLRVRRVCREVGRYQLRSCVNWVKLLGDSTCTYTRLRNEYAVGVHCGIANLARLYRRYGNWVDAIKRHNGDGPLADKYVEKALAYIGWRRLQ